MYTRKVCLIFNVSHLYLTGKHQFCYPKFYTRRKGRCNVLLGLRVFLHFQMRSSRLRTFFQAHCMSYFCVKMRSQTRAKRVGHKYMFRDRLAETVTRYKSALLDDKHTGTLKGKDIWCPLRVCCKGHLPLYQSPQSSLRPLLVLCVSMHCNTSPSVEIYAHELSLCYAAALS